MIELSAGELASLRGDMEATFIESAEIQRQTRTSNGRGGYTDSWAVVEVVQCRRPLPQNMRASAAEDLLAGRMQSVLTWIIAVPAGTDIRPSDRLVLQDGGRIFEVNDILTSSTEIARYVVATEFVEEAV